MTVVAQWAKAPGIHCYVAGSIPAVTPRYCTKKIEKCSLEHKKQRKKNIFIPPYLNLNSTETDIEIETDMKTETDNTRTWTWNWLTFAKYFIQRNCPYSAIWNASEIARRNFQWRYILVAPLQYEKKSYRCWNSYLNDVLAELEISV